MVLMDKMKECSCAIQPVFGYGGGGFNGLNLALMFDQLINNTENNIDTILVPDDESEDLLDSPMILSQIDGLHTPPANQLLPAHTGHPPSTAALQVSIQTTDPAFEGILQQPQFTELVTNIFQQHLASHHATPPQPNSSPLPVISATETAVEQESESALQQPQSAVTELIANAVQQHIATHHAALPQPNNGPQQIFIFPAVSLQQHTAAPNQSQTGHVGLMTNYMAPVAAPPQPVPPPIMSFQQYVSNLDQLLPSAVAILDSFTPSLLSNNAHSSSSPVLPPDEESNSSNPPFHAPFSSPNHSYFSNDLNPSGNEDSLHASNILIVDSAESPLLDIAHDNFDDPEVPN